MVNNPFRSGVKNANRCSTNPLRRISASRSGGDKGKRDGIGELLGSGAVRAAGNLHWP
jgi:hypothetical protein